MLKEKAKAWIVNEIIETTDQIMTLKGHAGKLLIEGCFVQCNLKEDMILADLPFEDLATLAFALIYKLEEELDDLGFPRASFTVTDVEYPPVKH